MPKFAKFDTFIPSTSIIVTLPVEGRIPAQHDVYDDAQRPHVTAFVIL